MSDFSIKIKSARVNVYNNDNGNSYTVIKHDDIWVCDCKAYQFCIEPKTCKHIAEVEESIQDYIPSGDDDED